MAKVLKGNSLWDSLKGVKSEAKEVVPIDFGGVEGEVTVIFREADVINDVNEEYSNKLPDKPKIKLDGLKEEITIPSEDYKKFNEHPKAVEWTEKAKPINREKIFRFAYEFIAEDERPSEDAEEGTKILQDRLRFMDAIEIMNTGMKLAGFEERLDKARKNS